MTIAAFISNSNSADQPLWECLARISTKYPEYHFIIFSDRVHWDNINSNITPVFIQPAIRNGLILHYWSQYKLPFILKRYNADIFISENSALSFRTGIPQLLFISDPALSENTLPAGYPFKTYLKKLLPWFVRKAVHVVGIEHPVVKKLQIKFKLEPGKTTCVSFGVSGSTKSWEEKDVLMRKYSDGHDYFVFIYDKDSSARSIEILKAFSIFKKWQKSSIRMILLNASGQGPVLKELQTYKYKSEIRVIQYNGKESFLEVISAAFALIQMSESRIAYNAMHMQIPVISSDTDMNRERFKDSVLYSQPASKLIAEQMMRIYKDENLRTELIDKATNMVALQDWDKTSLRLWETIVEYAEI